MSEPVSQTDAPSHRLAVRLSLSLVAIAFLWLMNRAFGAAALKYSETFRVPALLITAYVGFAVLAGFTFGLAAMLPRRIPAFHWRRALLLSALPALMVIVNILAFTAPSLLPKWLGELHFLFGLQAATAGAVLVGVAFSAALAER